MLCIVTRAVALFFLRECILIWRFIKNDIWDTVIPCFLTFAAAWIYNNKTTSELPQFIFTSFIYTILYILTFCIANQIASVEEDIVNKPDRPLPAGIITIKGCWKRIIFYNCCFIIAGYIFGVLWYAIGWQLTTFLLCGYCSRHWFLKNCVCITAGTVLLLAAEWQIVAPITTQVWKYIILLSLWAGFGLPVQDMRDQKGDKIMGRQTLPLEVGDRNARIIISLYFIFFSPVIYVAAIISQLNNIGITFWIIAILQTLWHWYIAARLWMYKSPAEDNTTYHYFVYLFCISIPLISLLKDV